MKKFVSGLLFVLFLTAAGARAQSIWTRPPEADARLSVEALRPSYDGLDPSLLSTAVFVSGEVAASDYVRFVAELPVSHFGADQPFLEEETSETAIGNPYVGAELQSPTVEAVSMELGARLPLASENSGLQSGLAAEQTNRFTAFFPDLASLQALFNYRVETNSPLRLRLRGGPQAALFTEGGDGELFFKYGAQAWYDTGPVLAGAGITGLGLLTGDGGSFNDRTVHSLTLTAIGDFEAVQPGLLLRAPLAEEQPSLVVGLTLTVPLW